MPYVPFDPSVTSANVPGIGTISFMNGQGVAVGRLAQFQENHQTIDAALRVGLPVAAFFLWKRRQRVAAAAALAGATTLWVNRLTKVNL
jgi:hypothetical protein